MALADLDPPSADPVEPAASGRFARPGGAPDAADSGRFARPDGAREGEPDELSAAVPIAPHPLAVPAAAPSARDAEVRRAARARQAVVARWLRQLSR